MKVLIVANACPWASWPQKLAAIEAFWAPLVALQIDVKQTDFTNIPTSTSEGIVTTFGPNGAFADTPGVNVDIDPSWLEENILPLAAGYDLVVLQIANQPPQAGLPLGFAYGKLQGVSLCVTLIAAETDNYYLGAVAPATIGVELGNAAEVLIEHEISHELYNLSGQTDNTHVFFYSNQFSKVLTDIKLPNQSALVILYQQLVADLQAELGLLKQTQTTADPQPPSQQQNLPPESVAAPQTTQTPPTGPSVSDLATVIKTVIEGWAAPGETLNGAPYPNGTISYQCNNPDNAKYDSQQYATARTFVINGVNEIFADFDTYEHGWEYILDTLTNICKGTPSIYTDAAQKLGLQNSGDLTLNDFFTVRDPASDANNPGAAAETAAKALNVPVTFQMKQFSFS